MLNLALIVGLWATSCIMTQNNTYSGWMIESFEISETGAYEEKREWFADPMCHQHYATERESGTLKPGPRMEGRYVHGDTYELDFETVMGTSLGVVRVEEKKLKFARGMRGSTLRNRMVGLFDYVKK